MAGRRLWRRRTTSPFQQAFTADCKKVQGWKAQQPPGAKLPVFSGVPPNAQEHLISSSRQKRAVCCFRSECAVSVLSSMTALQETLRYERHMGDYGMQTPFKA